MPKRKVKKAKYPQVKVVKHKGRDYIQVSTKLGPGLFTPTSFTDSLQRYDESTKRKKR